MLKRYGPALSRVVKKACLRKKISRPGIRVLRSPWWGVFRDSVLLSKFIGMSMCMFEVIPDWGWGNEVEHTARQAYGQVKNNQQWLQYLFFMHSRVTASQISPDDLDFGIPATHSSCYESCTALHLATTFEVGSQCSHYVNGTRKKAWGSGAALTAIGARLRTNRCRQFLAPALSTRPITGGR